MKDRLGSWSGEGREGIVCQLLSSEIYHRGSLAAGLHARATGQQKLRHWERQEWRQESKEL